MYNVKIIKLNLIQLVWPMFWKSEDTQWRILSQCLRTFKLDRKTTHALENIYFQLLLNRTIQY